MFTAKVPNSLYTETWSTQFKLSADFTYLFLLEPTNGLQETQLFSFSLSPSGYVHNNMYKWGEYLGNCHHIAMDDLTQQQKS